jgi:tetratricopeptide (TPR) repeat protein
MFKLSLHLTFILTCAILSAAYAQTPEQRPAFTPIQYVEEGNRYTQERQYDKAVDSFRQAMRLDPNLAAAYHGLGLVYINMGRASDALEPMKTAVRLDPNNSVAHLNLAITLEHLRRFDEALTELNEAKRLNPKDARNYHELGNLLNNFFGRLDEALAAYLEARRLDPNHPAVQHNIGLTLIKLGRAGEAIEPLQAALRLDPQYRNARYLLSDAYGILGRYEEAAKSWGKFLELVPNGPEALTKRSWSYLYLGGHGREAAADARQYLDVQGWRTQISTYMAIMAHLGYAEAGMEEEAQTILEEATAKANTSTWPYSIVRYLKTEISAEELLRLATDNDKKTEAHAYMGLALRLKGESEQAQQHFEWVREYGNKRFYEYPLALAELKRLGR